MSGHNHNARGVEIEPVYRIGPGVTFGQPQQETILVEWMPAGHAKQQRRLVDDQQILIAVQ